jgi:tripartite-type tricarboxylate transporter receptor subunit TctC
MRAAGIAFALGVVAAGLPAAAQDDVASYPNRQITLITVTAPGAALDSVARTIGSGLQDQMGQSVVVINRVGAGGNIGVGELARSKPDGYTVGMITGGTHGVNPSFIANAPFDPIKDFQPITMAAELNIILNVRSDFPAKTLQELVAWGKANPAKLSFGSAGVGTGLHMTGELARMKTGIDMVHVPYPGVAKSLPDLLGGQLQVLMANPADVGNLIRDGQVRGLAVAAKVREPTLPDIPTFTELGFPDVVGTTWFGVAAPAGLPKPILDRLHREIHILMKKPQTKERLDKLGMNIVLNQPDEFLVLIKSEIAKWAPIVAAAKAAAPK